jgi:CMP-N-acetylneuraminic acid synthetase
MKFYAIIPARGGSKGVPRKNIALLGGYPLLAYAIAAAKLTPLIERIVVSTDDEEIASVARKFGAEVPFLRPAEIAQDTSRDIEFMLHAIRWLRDNEGIVPEYLVELRTTTPLRHPHDVQKAVEMIQKYPEATSLISSHEIRESPHKLFRKSGDYFEGLFPHDPRPEYWNLPRQEFPPIYQPDGYVDILKTSYMEEHQRLQGDRMLAFESPDTGEVDKAEDLKFIQFKLDTEQWEVYEYLKNNFG